MSLFKAIFAILTQDTDVSGEVDTRVIIVEAPQKTSTPFVIMNWDLLDESFTKSGPSKLDTYDLKLDIYHDNFTQAETLGGYIRAALDNYNGTIDGVIVQGIKMQPGSNEPDKDMNKKPIWKQDYKVRIGNP